uniref:Uncharacterized protein n=1 Tax=Arundo donax TaxID=35708 RepID=A0A0A9HBG9_ARUDO
MSKIKIYVIHKRKMFWFSILFDLILKADLTINHMSHMELAAKVTMIAPIEYD